MCVIAKRFGVRRFRAALARGGRRNSNRRPLDYRGPAKKRRSGGRTPKPSEIRGLRRPGQARALAKRLGVRRFRAALARGGRRISNRRPLDYRGPAKKRRSGGRTPKPSEIRGLRRPGQARALAKRLGVRRFRAALARGGRRISNRRPLDYRG